MKGKFFLGAVFLVASFGLATPARADLISGSTVKITSTFFDGVTNHTETQSNLSVVEDSTAGDNQVVNIGNPFGWMVEGDYIDFYEDSSGHNVLRVFLEGTDRARFVSTESITLTLQLTGAEYDDTALTTAIDVTIPSASLTSDTLMFEISGLDQIGDPSSDIGEVEYTFIGGDNPDPILSDLSVPEPATLSLVGLGIVGLIRRRKSALPKSS